MLSLLGDHSKDEEEDGHHANLHAEHDARMRGHALQLEDRLQREGDDIDTIWSKDGDVLIVRVESGVVWIVHGSCKIWIVQRKASLKMTCQWFWFAERSL
jgi:hypothetical protein